MSDAKINELIPDPNNANKGTQRGLKALDKSLRQYGAGRSILLDRDNRIIAGNKTAERAMDIGLEDVQIVDSDGTKLIAVRRTDLDLEDDGGKARALATYDNRVGQLDLEWDLDALGAIDADVLGDLWSDKELADLGVNLGEPPDDPGAQIDKADELRQKWGVETGQLWKLGEHRLICGDCTDKAAVDALMMGEKAGACVTDSPYGINRDGIENDDPEGLRALFDGCLVHMPIDNGVTINFQSPRLFPVWLDAVRAHGHKFERALWMHKPNDSTTFPWRGWLMVGEIIIITSAGRAEWKLPKDYKHDCYVVELGKQNDVNGLHTTPKPPDVVENLIDNTTGIIYDPFLGSGTTLIACERLGRKCRAVEISPGYVAVAIQRWVDMTGGTPELISNT